MTGAPTTENHPGESCKLTHHSRRIKSVCSTKKKNFKSNYEYQAAKLEKKKLKHSYAKIQQCSKSFEATNTMSQCALNPLHSLSED